MSKNPYIPYKKNNGFIIKSLDRITDRKYSENGNFAEALFRTEAFDNVKSHLISNSNLNIISQHFII